MVPGVLESEPLLDHHGGGLKQLVVPGISDMGLVGAVACQIRVRHMRIL